MTLHVRLEIARQQMWITVYVCMEKRGEGETYMNFKFSGEGKVGQNNMVLETLRNKNRVFL